MTIYFGENIKRLRKEKELTQETLADFLGVSFQTISKWERGETYPDITMLPIISRFFNTTVDNLLGVNKSREEKQIKEYLRLYDEMKLKDLTLTFNKFQEAVKEFPNDFRILIRYMELLYEVKGFGQGKYKDISKEIASIYEKIQNRCTDDNIRIRSKVIMISHLVTLYQCVPNEEGKYRVYKEYLNHAEEIVSTLPSINDTKELMLMSLAFDTENYNTTHRNALEELLFIIQDTLFGYSYDYKPEKRLEILKHIQGLINLIFDDGNFGKNCVNRLYNYGHIGHLYHQIGDDENALKYLKITAEYAKELDENPDISQKVMRHYNFGPIFRETNLSQFMKIVMTEHYPLSDDFKSKPEFQEIIKILE
ncbi:MAG: helix-turn-helix transcriptional regulator [Clostridia bacterium]|nr:helix-turn-helix transcriptional regulator [Clostridia bacterium]